MAQNLQQNEGGFGSRNDLGLIKSNCKTLPRETLIRRKREKFGVGNSEPTFR